MSRNRPPKWLEAARKGAAPGKDDWLARALGKAGAVPDAQVEKAIFSGRIDVNGAVVRDPMHPVRRGDVVRFDGRPVPLDAPSIVLMFHKPAGSVCAPTDPERDCTVFSQLVPQLPPDLKRYAWHVVGRLDRGTTGLLLFTNDPAVVDHVTSPETGLAKRYVARVEGRPDDARLEPIRRGIAVEDGPARPAEARLLAPGIVEITVREGRHHLVRRMLNAIHLPVLALHRESIGTLQLDIPEAGWRKLTRDEIAADLGLS